ncbi:MULTISPECIES: helix-turn-helix domain-containing protein [unclassified Maridesulfovibrio]|uniref:helix-turn-helix domain-containing protein n=1 Tax=unclassified Maridesulfovibrio TaxID=2794999 RepID=UPI003B414328
MDNFTPNAILNFINLTTQFGLIADYSGRVVHCNPVLSEMLRYPVETLHDVFGQGYTIILQLQQDSIAERTMLPFEIDMDFGDGIHRVFGQIYPVETDTEYQAMMLFHPVDNLQRLESVFFERQSKLPTDSRWVVDENYKTLKFSADPDSIFYGREPGFSLSGAIQAKDHAALDAAFEKAMLSQGDAITITVDARRKYGISRVEIDVIYGPDQFYGNRYYVMTRPAVNRALGILERMWEAYKVDNDKNLAARLGVVASSISNVRIHNREVPPAWIIQCLLDCKVRFRWLYGGVGKKRY